MATCHTHLKSMNPSSDGSFGLAEMTEFISQHYTTTVAESWSERLMTDIIGEALEPVTEAGQPTRYNYDDLVMYFDQVKQTGCQEFGNSPHSPGMIAIEMLADTLPATVAA